MHVSTADLLLEYVKVKARGQRRQQEELHHAIVVTRFVVHLRGGEPLSKDASVA